MDSPFGLLAVSGTMRVAAGQSPVAPDPSLSHAADILRMYARWANAHGYQGYQGTPALRRMDMEASVTTKGGMPT